MAEFLLNKGAAIDAKAFNGETPLDFAIQEGNNWPAFFN